MKSNALKKFIVAALVALVAVAAVGCGTEITYYYTATDSGYYKVYAITIPKAGIAEIEAVAADDIVGGGKWTVEKYIEKFAEKIGGTSEKNVSSDAVTYTISRSVKRTDDDESDDSSPEPTIKRGFLFNKYTYETDSPFGGVYAELDGDGTPAASSLTDILKNGLTDNNAQKVLPALNEAFPSINYSDFADVKTTFVWNNSRIVPVNGGNGYLNGKRVAVWESTLGDSPKLVYEYSVPNSVGWYVLIAAIGCITVTIIMLATRGSEKNPKMVRMQSGRRVYPRVGGFYSDDYRSGNRNRSDFTDNIRVIDPFDDEPDDNRETPEDARKDLDDIFFGDD